MQKMPGKFYIVMFTNPQTHRDDCGETSSQLLPQLCSRLPPEHEGGKGAEEQPSTVQPADGREAVQNGLQHNPLQDVR